ncbi:hypothetical protein OEZ86_008246 [Tetradesmus obliquus]|nr:hypothetical protein OEZ86_008246 [Tetradesmus obliquus]
MQAFRAHTVQHTRISRPQAVRCAASGKGPAVPGAALPAPPTAHSKAGHVSQLLAAKEASGKTFSQIAAEVGLTNVYTTQLFYGQQQLQPNTISALRKAVPALSEADVAGMMRAPMRSYDPTILQEPAIYRLHEAITHGGEAIKALINEEFGDGIMSAIGFYATVDKMTGNEGEARVVITFNGKFLPYVEQKAAENVAQVKQQ